jgi:predicted DNA-binding transcriptional regulator AlpA
MDTELGFLSRKEVLELVKLSATQIARLEEVDKFPKRQALPGPLGVTRTSRRVWWKSEIYAWLRARFAERD